MPETKLNAEEAQAVRTALSAKVIKNRTGELGIMHGLDRLVSTQRILKKPERDVLHAAARKVGLDGIREDAG